MADRFRFVIALRLPVVGASVEFIRRWILVPPIVNRWSLRLRLRLLVPRAAVVFVAPLGGACWVCCLSLVGWLLGVAFLVVDCELAVTTK